MPMGPYADFEDCVAKNRGKVANPEAYCGAIKHRIEGGIDIDFFEFAIHGGPRDGDWVRARPMGWDQIEDNPDIIVGGAPHAAPLTGLLTIIKSSVPGVARYSVAGLTVDPATIQVINPPSQ